MLYNRTYDRWLIVLIPVGFFVYMSTRPILRLQSGMPPQFVDVRQNAGRAQRTAEQHLAQAYWDVAVRDVQWKYTYGSPLPDAPPDEFQLTIQPPPGSEPLSFSRVRYWQRLRQVWLLPTSWVGERGWSTEWLTGPMIRGATWIRNYLRDLVPRA